MVEIMGKKYITDKEASSRYGYSQSWFINKRYKGNGPLYIKIGDNGKVLYPLFETDEWFLRNMKIKE